VSRPTGPIAVIGSSGQLGSELVQVAARRGFEVEALSHARVEVTDAKSVERALARIAPAVVINTAAYQGAASYAAADQERHFAVNALAPWELARFCARHGAILVHYSTDYVFGGESRSRPYAETDLPYPINAYGASKLAGEHLVRAAHDASYVLRVASLYGTAGSRAKGGSNFVKAILAKAGRGEPLDVVADQTMSPTWTRDVAERTLDLLGRAAPYGLYHMAGSGSCTWHELATEIVRLAGLDVPVRPTSTEPEAPGAQFRRPRNTALVNAALARAELDDLPDWRVSLRSYVALETGATLNDREMQHA
jgi:dTDP-4-dehydrorhamnose reductase